MPDLMEFIRIDLPALTAGILATLTCGLIGTFLVLRKQSLLGDALSHSVLPGIVIGFLLTGLKSIIVIFLGALISALFAGIMIELIHQMGRIERGAAMGVVFTSLFALGVLLLEQSSARSADLDPDCVLYGQLEQIMWLAPKEIGDLLKWQIWFTLPRQIYMLFTVFFVVTICVGVFFKELKLIAFDPDYAKVVGFKYYIYNYGLMFLTSIAIVASFETVGSILVIALLICPAAIMRLLTSSYLLQFWGTLGMCLLISILGYSGAVFFPLSIDASDTINVAGAMSVVCGLLMFFAFLYYNYSNRHRGSVENKL